MDQNEQYFPLNAEVVAISLMQDDVVFHMLCANKAQNAFDKTVLSMFCYVQPYIKGFQSPPLKVLCENTKATCCSDVWILTLPSIKVI